MVTGRVKSESNEHEKAGRTLPSDPIWSFDTECQKTRMGERGISEGVKTAGPKLEQWTGLIQKNHSGYPLKTSEQAVA